MQQFISSVNDATRRRDGPSLAKIIALPLKKTPIPTAYSQFAQQVSKLNAMAYCTSNIRGDSAMAILVGNMCLALEAFCNQRWEEAYDFEVLVYEAALAYFKESDTNWSSPVLITASNDLRILASIVSNIRDMQYFLLLIIIHSLMSSCIHISLTH
jgi:hypothetical protein